MKAFVGVYLALFLMISIGYSQDIPTLNQNALLDRENPKYQSSLEKYYKEHSITRIVMPQVLENEINDSLYILGPGDQLNIHLFGENEITYTVTVSPEGIVAIPTIGILRVGALTLKEAKRKINDLINKNYHATAINIDLTGLRKFRVYLVGEVVNPGTYFAQATDRVSDIIEASGGLKDWADVRSIRIRHKNGTTDSLDILQFYASGEKTGNPNLHGGDVIYVPPVNLSDSYVIVEWNEEKQTTKSLTPNQTPVSQNYQRKIYRIAKNESLTDFLNRISVLHTKSELSCIKVIRSGREFTINLFNEINKGEKFVLQNKDILVIPDINDKVYVQGEVMYPGAYPYQINLTANDYASMSGILEKSKTGNNIVVIRARDGKVLRGANVVVEKGDLVVVPRKTRESVRDYLTIITPIVSIMISTYTLYLAITKK